MNDENLPDGRMKAGKSMLFLMAAACAFTVANLYYIQPLLTQVARTFGIPDSQAGIVSTITQVGYALGLFLFVPLGDMVERRSLVVLMTALAGAALLAIAFSANEAMVLCFSLALGMITIVPQLIVPLAAHVSSPEDRGRNIGFVMSGLLIGILLSRVFSGLVGEVFGWRAVYRIAAGAMIVFAVMLRRFLPQCPPVAHVSYRELLASLGTLVKTEPVLREASVNGALMFAAFSAFWTCLVFLLGTPVYRMGSQEAGLFSLTGVCGALMAPLVGKIADRRGARFSVGISTVLSCLAYLAFWLFGQHLFGLIAGVILLDLGTQSGQVSNQTRIHALSDEMRSRINTVFMVSYFIGGSLGSFLGSFFWGRYQWNGVCAVGGSFLLLALVFHFAVYRPAIRKAADTEV